jgi:hypothetical protein
MNQPNSKKLKGLIRCVNNLHTSTVGGNGG